MAFYLLVSIAMVLPGRTWPSVIAAITACVCGGIVANRLGVNSPQLLSSPIPLYLEFALGIVIAHVILDRPVPVASTIGLIVVFGIISVRPRRRVAMAGSRIGCPRVLAVLCAAWIDKRKLPLSGPGRLFARLGDASYSIYLVQVFVISIACKLLAVVAPRLPLDAAILLMSLVTLLIAYGVHLGIEKPVIRLFHRRDRLAAKSDGADMSGPHKCHVKPTFEPCS